MRQRAAIPSWGGLASCNGFGGRASGAAGALFSWHLALSVVAPRSNQPRASHPSALTLGCSVDCSEACPEIPTGSENPQQQRLDHAAAYMTLFNQLDLIENDEQDHPHPPPL